MSRDGSASADLELRQLSKSYASVVAVSDVSISIRQGEFIVLLGPSGCGKTTTLRMVAGFVRPSSGKILLRNHDITHTPPNRRDIGMVFQSYALFPHMTVAANVKFGLNCRHLPRSEVRRRCAEALETVGLDSLEARYPRELSGGQQQRVALARVLALKPSLLLFDEPLSNLDAKLRLHMRAQIQRLQREIGITALFVTHDQEEAMAIADRIVILNQGGIEQIGTAQDIYDRPQSRFVAEFIGTSNLIEGGFVPDTDGARFRTSKGLVVALTQRWPGRAVSRIALRPEKIDLVEGDRKIGVPATVLQATHLGATIEYVVALECGDVLRITDLRRGDRKAWSQGDVVGASWRDQDVVVIPD